MSSMSEDIQCVGSDTRPPMLDRTDFESWQQRIRLYCLGKDNGENIMKSINEGPFHMGTVSDVIAGETEGAVQQGPIRARVLNDLSAEENERNDLVLSEEETNMSNRQKRRTTLSSLAEEGKEVKIATVYNKSNSSSTNKQPETIEVPLALHHTGNCMNSYEQQNQNVG
ncbi:hypothetical protein Tco_1108416 [Tanacetum coccineum]